MKPITLFTAAALILGGWLLIARQSAQAEPVALVVEPTVHGLYDPAAIDRTIAFHESRVVRDPKGPLGWAMLAEAWLARSRESDQDSAAWRAEEAARQSLALRSRGNPRAQKALVESLLEQHRFQDALTAMRDASIRTPMLADALIEVGRHDDARRVLDELPRQDDAPVLAVRARLALVHEDAAGAAHLLARAQTSLESNPATPVATLAWFEVKRGEAAHLAGDQPAARRHLLRALDFYPANYKAALALARLAYEEGKWSEAEAFARRTLETANSLDAIAILGDVAAARGNTDGASRWYAECQTMFLAEETEFGRSGKGGPLAVRPIDRQFATFSANHGLFPNDGRRAARRDHQNRPDATAVANLAALPPQP